MEVSQEKSRRQIEGGEGGHKNTHTQRKWKNKRIIIIIKKKKQFE